MKLSYFPYLPNSKNEDNKRYKYVCDKIEKDPFTYHKKKNSSFLFNKFYIVPENNLDLNQNQNKVNQELLFFQNENDKYINSFNSFMKKKSSIIADNAENYLNYISQSKKLKNLESSDVNNTNTNNKINNYFNYSHQFQENKTKKSLFKNKSEPDLIGFSPKRYNNELYKNKTLEGEKNNSFIPSLIKANGSDITNPFFYDQVAKEIIKKNQEVMAYNIQESEYKLKQKRNTSKFSDDKIAIAPGKINNPNYYNLGESFLTKNPILNKGDYSPSFSYNANYFNRHKNIFGK